MIPIFIKCSHRAFYLDRLLASLEANLVGRGSVILLNDGIKDEFLEKLFEKYPWISERKSKNCRAGAGGQSASERVDPASFWVEEIQAESSANMLLLEEDTWLQSKIDLQAIDEYFSRKPILILMMVFLEEQRSRQVYARETWAPGFEVEYYNVKIDTDIDFYSLFGMAHNVFRKDYWLAAYGGISRWTREGEMLANAARFLSAQQASGASFYLCKTKNRPIAQSGLTTARKDSGGPKLEGMVDWNLYNEVLNQAWLEGDLDPIAGFPLDFPIATIGGILRERLGNDAWLHWDQWRQRFVKMYRDLPGHLATPG